MTDMEKETITSILIYYVTSKRYIQSAVKLTSE